MLPITGDEIHYVHAPKVVYELRGDIEKEGFFCFYQQQTIGELLQITALSQREGAFEESGELAFSQKLQSGKKITFKRGCSDAFVFAIEPMSAAACLNFFMPVSINTSTTDELELIPGVGKKTAGALVAYREKNKGIKNLNDLAHIKGIGKRKLESLLPYLTSD